MRTAITVTVSLPPELAEELKEASSKLGMTRSLIVQQLIRVELKQFVARATKTEHTKHA